MIGQRIKQRRKELHLTQIQIRELTGISNGNLSELENGNKLPSAGALISLSQTLEVTTDWILFGENSERDIYPPNNIPLTPSEESYLNCFRQLSSDDQEEILTLVNLKISRQKKKKKSSLSAPDQASGIA